jgi:hypothetical protein
MYMYNEEQFCTESSVWGKSASSQEQPYKSIRALVISSQKIFMTSLDNIDFKIWGSHDSGFCDMT